MKSYTIKELNKLLQKYCYMNEGYCGKHHCFIDDDYYCCPIEDFFEYVKEKENEI